MRGLTSKLILVSVLSFLMLGSGSSNAGVNPFKKSKNHTFGESIPWYESAGSVIKSGEERSGSDTLYYHLNIDKYRMLLRLGKNDPSGELMNTRVLDRLVIADVMADGHRIPIFDWCVNNQQDIGRKLKQNSLVPNDTCVNAGGGGDFVINLDEQTKTILKMAQTLEFVIEPYGRPLRLIYSMNGFAPLMAKIDRPAPVAVPVAKTPEQPAVVAKPKPKPKPKPVKKCYAKAPADFKSVVRAVAYPCNNAAKKAAAEKKVVAGVAAEKQKMEAELEAAKREEALRQKAVEDNKRQAEWEVKQAAMWVSRCKKRWAKGVSPCYCEKYLDQAPEGITSNPSCAKSE